MHDKVETFRAKGDDGTDYVVVRIRPYRRADTLEGVGGYLDFTAPRLSSGEVLEPAQLPGTFRVPQTGVVLTVDSPKPWLSGAARASIRGTGAVATVTGAPPRGRPRWSWPFTVA